MLAVYGNYNKSYDTVVTKKNEFLKLITCPFQAIKLSNYVILILLYGSLSFTDDASAVKKPEDFILLDGIVKIQMIRY